MHSLPQLDGYTFGLRITLRKSLIVLVIRTENIILDVITKVSSVAMKKGEVFRYSFLSIPSCRDGKLNIFKFFVFLFTY